MTRYINANAFRKKVKTASNPYGKSTIDYESGTMVLTMLDNEPTADVEEIRYGAWIRRQKIYGIGYEYVCSVCEKGVRQYEGQPICSECGARMNTTEI